MTGICYFANDEVEYFAEQQVNSIVNNIDDGARLIRESDSFSPELVDNLIEEAVNQKCDKLVLMVESKKYNQYKQVIPKVYGDMFESIEVVPENFVRVRESNNYDYYDGMEADAVFWADKYDEYVDAGMTDPDDGIVGFVAGKIDEEHPSDSPEQYASLERWVMSILKEKGYFKMPWMTESVMRENDGVQTTAANGAAALPPNGQQQTQQQAQPNYEKTTKIYFSDAVIPTAQNVLNFVNGHKSEGTQMTFMTLDSAHIYGASVPSIISAYPQSQSSISKFADNFNNVVPDFTLNTDPASIVAAFAKALNLQARQDTVQVGFPKAYKDFVNKLNAARGNITNIEFAILNENSMVNSDNENIFKLMMLFKDSKKALEKDPNRAAKWDKDDIGNKNKTIKENHKYISAIAAAMEYYEKNKDNKVKDRKSIQSAVLEALKDQLKQWSGYNNAKTEIKNNSAIGKFAIETAEKIGAAVKKDLQKDQKEKEKTKEDPSDRTEKSLYCWKYYENLCGMLKIKPE